MHFVTFLPFHTIILREREREREREMYLQEGLGINQVEVRFGYFTFAFLPMVALRVYYTLPASK